jgi:hypothetical protein
MSADLGTCESRRQQSGIRRSPTALGGAHLLQLRIGRKALRRACPESVRLGSPRANDDTRDTVWLAEVTCFGGIDRMQLTNCGSCVRSHPPTASRLAGPAVVCGGPAGITDHREPFGVRGSQRPRRNILGQNLGHNSVMLRSAPRSCPNAICQSLKVNWEASRTHRFGCQQPSCVTDDEHSPQTRRVRPWSLDLHL